MMRPLRVFPVLFGWMILNLSVLVFKAATGLGWFGELVIRAGMGDE